MALEAPTEHSASLRVSDRETEKEMTAFHSAFHLFARQAATLPLDLSAANWQSHKLTNNNFPCVSIHDPISRTASKGKWELCAANGRQNNVVGLRLDFKGHISCVLT